MYIYMTNPSIKSEGWVNCRGPFFFPQKFICPFSNLPLCCLPFFWKLTNNEKGILILLLLTSLSTFAFSISIAFTPCLYLSVPLKEETFTHLNHSFLRCPPPPIRASSHFFLFFFLFFRVVFNFLPKNKKIRKNKKGSF